MNSIPENLVMFLYMLLRDHLVIGNAMIMRNEVLKVENIVVDYTNKHLEAIARELAQNLTNR